jgi:hypothetical protein
MRISDDRYHRDRLRLDIAVKFIEREARTHTIRQWTGLSDDRIRKLYRSYLFDGSGRGVRRHRGKSPHQSAHFMRTARMRQDASLLASVCALAGMLPRPGSTPAARFAPTIQRGHLLCQAYDAYRALVPKPVISFEHAVFLVGTLTRRDELTLATCQACSALIIVDRFSLRAAHCFACGGETPEFSGIAH